MALRSSTLSGSTPFRGVWLSIHPQLSSPGTALPVCGLETSEPRSTATPPSAAHTPVPPPSCSRALDPAPGDEQEKVPRGARQRNKLSRSTSEAEPASRGTAVAAGAGARGDSLSRGRARQAASAQRGEAPRCGCGGWGAGGTPSCPSWAPPPPSSAGDDGAIRESHGFLRGRLGGGRDESTEAGTLGDAHDSAPGKGASPPPAPRPGARLWDGCWSEIAASSPAICYSPGLFSPSPRGEARVTMATVCPMPPLHPGPGNNCPFLKERPASVAAGRSR